MKFGQFYILLINLSHPSSPTSCSQQVPSLYSHLLMYICHSEINRIVYMEVETLKWWWAGDKGRTYGRRKVVWFFETDPARLEVMILPQGPEW